MVNFHIISALGQILANSESCPILGFCKRLKSVILGMYIGSL